NLSRFQIRPAKSASSSAGPVRFGRRSPPPTGSLSLGSDPLVAARIAPLYYCAMAIHIERSINVNTPPERVCAFMMDIDRLQVWPESMKSGERLDSGEYVCGGNET